MDIEEITEIYVNKLNRKCLYRDNQDFVQWSYMDIVLDDRYPGYGIDRYCHVRYIEGRKIEILCPMCRKNLEMYDNYLNRDNIKIEYSNILDRLEVLRSENYAIIERINRIEKTLSKVV